MVRKRHRLGCIACQRLGLVSRLDTFNMLWLDVFPDRLANGLAISTWARTRSKSHGVSNQYPIYTRRCESIEDSHLSSTYLREVVAPRHLRPRGLRKGDCRLGALAASRPPLKTVIGSFRSARHNARRSDPNWSQASDSRVRRGDRVNWASHSPRHARRLARPAKTRPANRICYTPRGSSRAVRRRAYTKRAARVERRRAALAYVREGRSARRPTIARWSAPAGATPSD
jgi:hypothetical protein